MKVFISADIEGVTTCFNWKECDSTHPSYGRHADQMTREVLAACEGAFAAGATEIVVNDAHDGGNNIDPTRIPEGVVLQRGWSGHPYSMAEGVDSSFDCALFIGYHSAASRPGNPLSHTFTGRPAVITINGQVASEFLIYSWACALEGVPTVLLTGDRMLCQDSAPLHPALLTVPVKDGVGAMTRNLSPATTLRQIKETAQRAVSQDLKAAKITLPGHFDVEIRYKEHTRAHKVSFFPGVTQADACTVTFSSDSYLEVLRTLLWIL